MNISVLGAGAWGTALAMAAAQRHDVLLWARDARAGGADATRSAATQRYLPERAAAAALRVSADHDAALRHARGGLLVIATPMAALRERLAALPPELPALWLCKGFEAGSGELGHEIARELRPGARVPACCRGRASRSRWRAANRPRWWPPAATRRCARPRSQAFHSDTLRVYRSADPVGVEVGGAVKNVLAIATGLVDGLAAHDGEAHRPGLNARAALITRGLAEMTRLGVALGARAETFMGLSGLGDLVLTATGDLSRNRRVGLLLAQGLAAAGHPAASWAMWPKASTARRRVLARAQALRRARCRSPQAVVDVLEGRIDAAARDVRS